MNLISAALKTEVNSAMQNLFDSFKKEQPLVFYKTAAQTVVAHDPNFNADFEYQFNSSVTTTAQSQSFYCRVWYLDRQEFSSFIEGGEDAGIKGKFYYNRIRLQMESDAFEYLKNTEKFLFFDEQFRIEEGWQRIGALGTFQFYEVILRRVN